jgi:hypothetical protein
MIKNGIIARAAAKVMAALYICSLILKHAERYIGF